MKGIDIRITDKAPEEGSKSDCLFCTGTAKFWVLDGRDSAPPVVQVRVCESPECCALAFQYILSAAYGFPVKGARVPHHVHAFFAGISG